MGPQVGLLLDVELTYLLIFKTKEKSTPPGRERRRGKKDTPFDRANFSMEGRRLQQFVGSPYARMTVNDSKWTNSKAHTVWKSGVWGVGGDDS